MTMLQVFTFLFSSKFDPNIQSAPMSTIASLPITSSNTHSMVTQAKMGMHKLKVHSTITIDQSFTKPNSFKQALSRDGWKYSMQAEFHNLLKNVTWVLVPPPKDRNIIWCKWVWRVKNLSPSLLDKLKSRVVGKRFHQQLEFDFTEIFGLMGKKIIV